MSPGGNLAPPKTSRSSTVGQGEPLPTERLRAEFRRRSPEPFPPTAGPLSVAVPCRPTFGGGGGGPTAPTTLHAAARRREAAAVEVTLVVSDELRLEPVAARLEGALSQRRALIDRVEKMSRCVPGIK